MIFNIYIILSRSILFKAVDSSFSMQLKLNITHKIIMHFVVLLVLYIIEDCVTKRYRFIYKGTQDVKEFVNVAIMFVPQEILLF